MLLLMVTMAPAQMVYLKGMLQGAQEVPANSSPATGLVIVKYDLSSRTFELSGTYTGLTTAAVASHIHGPARPDSTGDVLFGLVNSGGTEGTLYGKDTLNTLEEAAMLNGFTYVNVHTSNYPAGEVRAQLKKVAEGEALFFSASLQGAQEVPPNSSAATGSTWVLVDTNKDSIYVTGSFSGLTAAASAAHIHKNGPPGVNGPVMLPLQVTKSQSGILMLDTTITDADVAEMKNGAAYVNVHNASYPGGEIRGQLTMLAQLYYLKATLQGTQEVPANASPGVGTVIIKYNPETNILELTGDYQNVTSPITAAHIHSPAAPGTTAGVLVPLTHSGGTSGTLTGLDTLSDADELNLMGGLMYVNVHNANYPGGELRGQITAATGGAHYFTGLLQGAQEVPANTSAATGTVAVLLDKGTNMVYVTGSFSGLSTPATAAHIHHAPAGMVGPVAVGLSVTAATAGTVTGTATVSASLADSMVKGFTYVNIHTTTYPGGELRAQLASLVLPLKLIYFNGYKEGNNIALLWQTAEEINVRRFEIEQQNMATRTWSVKGTVAAKGGAGTNSYRFSDVPLAGNNYALYRLKIVDADGRYSYSPVVSISYVQGGATLTIYGNPVTNGMLTFSVSGLGSEEKANIMVLDNSGRIVKRISANALQTHRVPVGNLSTGMYRLVVYVKGNMLQKNFTKN